jgi:insulysin
MYNVNYMLRPTRWHNDDKLAVVDALEPEDMRHFASRLLSNAFCEVLVHGNSSSEDAKALVGGFESALNYSALRPSQNLQVMAPRCMQLPGPASDAVHRMPGLDPENENSAINLYWQVGPRDVRSGALLGLLAHLVREPCFDQLRTKEQLGYMVFSGMSDVNGVVGLWIIVQSSNKGPAYLDNRAENFLAQFREEVLGTMDSGTFAENVQSCILTRTKKDKQLYEQASRFWNEIEDCRYRFNRPFDEAEALKSVTLDDVIRLFDECIAKSGPKRRKLGCHVLGKGHAESDNALYEAQLAAGVTAIGASQLSMDEFKMGMGMFRVPTKSGEE